MTGEVCLDDLISTRRGDMLEVEDLYAACRCDSHRLTVSQLNRDFLSRAVRCDSIADCIFYSIAILGVYALREGQDLYAIGSGVLRTMCTTVHTGKEYLYLVRLMVAVAEVLQDDRCCTIIGCGAYR